MKNSMRCLRWLPHSRSAHTESHLYQTACHREFRMWMMFNKVIMRNKQWKRISPKRAYRKRSTVSQTARNCEFRSISSLLHLNDQKHTHIIVKMSIRWSIHINTVSYVLHEHKQLGGNKTRCISVYWIHEVCLKGTAV